MPIRWGFLYLINPHLTAEGMVVEVQATGMAAVVQDTGDQDMAEPEQGTGGRVIVADTIVKDISRANPMVGANR